MSRLFDDLDDLWTDPALPGEEESRVLVAVMNDPRALETARKEGWYRIPVQRAPPRVGADYLAFYQTAAFGPDERWAINYFASVRRYRIVRRCDLLPEESEHPRAGDEYFKIEIGPLERLPHPIPSRRLRRITFIPTTLKKLLNAEEVNDLWLGSRAQECLWELLKAEGIAVERKVSVREDDETLQMDFAIYCKTGKLALFCESDDFGGLVPVKETPAINDYELTAHGWTTLRFQSVLSPSWGEEAVIKVRQAVERLGGLAD